MNASDESAAQPTGLMIELERCLDEVRHWEPEEDGDTNRRRNAPSVILALIVLLQQGTGDNYSSLYA